MREKNSISRIMQLAMQYPHHRAKNRPFIMISAEAKTATPTSNHSVKDTKYNLIQHRKTTDSFITYQRSSQRDNKMEKAQAGALGTVLKEGGEEGKEKQRHRINNRGEALQQSPNQQDCRHLILVPRQQQLPFQVPAQCAILQNKETQATKGHKT